MSSSPSTSKKRRSAEKKKKEIPAGLDKEAEREWDQFLDEKAEKYNVSRRLGKQIVKNIIASEESEKLFKVAVGLADASELPEQKLTRSKTKVTIPMRPVDIPKLGGRAPNFLYVDDFGNEEEDTDFVVDEGDEEASSSSSSSSSEEELEEEEDEREVEAELAELAEGPSENYEERYPWVNSLSEDVNLNSVAMDHLADTNRELYYQMLEKDWNDADEDFFEANDPDYNYEEDEKEEEPDSYEPYTHNMTVPKRECTLLLEEAYYETIDVAAEKKRLKKDVKRNRRPHRNQRHVKDAPMPDDQSCSLLKAGPLIFRECELAQLTSQLEQHVQLLTQMIVLCRLDKTKTEAANRFQIMFNEIDKYEIEAQNQGKRSHFSVSNFSDAIATIHDLSNIQKVPDLLVNWRNAPAPAGYFPRPEACLAFSRSKALLYPELVCFVQPHNKPSSNSKWTPVEETLLFLGMIQFGYVPNSTQTLNDGRYYQIHRNLIPTRTPQQISTHLSSIRKAPNPNPLQQMILDAEDRNPKVKIEPRSVPVRLPTTMDLWPAEWQPCWYEPFKELFCCCGNLIYTRPGPSNIHLPEPGSCSNVILPSNMTLMIKSPDGTLQPVNLNGEGLYLVNSSASLAPQQLQVISTVVPVAAAVPMDPQPSPSEKMLEKSTIPEDLKSVPEPELFIDIERVSSPEEVEPVTSLEDSRNRDKEKTLQKAPETPVESLESQPGPSSSFVPVFPPPPSPLNKRKQSKPMKIVPQPRVKRKSSGVKRNSRQEEEEKMLKRKRFEQLRQDLMMSDDSNLTSTILSPMKNVCSKEPSPSEFKTDVFIPMTPRCTSDLEDSDVPLDDFEIDEDFSSPPRITDSQLSAPKTPRDDNFTTQSPTLMRLDPGVAQTILSKMKLHSTRNLFPAATKTTGPTDFTILSSQEKVENYVQTTFPYIGPCSSNQSPIPERVPEQPRVINLVEPKKWRKRTRQEMIQDGKDGMADLSYRQKQEQQLCKHILADIKTRLTLRRDLYNKVQDVFRKHAKDPKQILQETYYILHSEYPEVFGLIACLFPDTCLPKQAEGNKHKKAYKEAIEMLMAIDAYTVRSKFKNSNSKNSKFLFRLMAEFCSQQLSPKDFGQKMKDLFSEAPPLWDFIKTKLPVSCEERPDPIKAEFVDLTKPIPVDLTPEIVDFSRVMGPAPPKKRTRTVAQESQISLNSDLNSMEINSFPKFAAPIGRAPHSRVLPVEKAAPTTSKENSVSNNEGRPKEQKKKGGAAPEKAPKPSWTKELDMEIITAYNAFDEEDDSAVVEALLPKIPQFSRQEIASRLEYLLSQF